MRKILSTDGYKLSHFEQYPKTALSLYGNLTARSDKHFKQALTSSLPLGDLTKDMNLVKEHKEKVIKGKGEYSSFRYLQLFRNN